MYTDSVVHRPLPGVVLVGTLLWAWPRVCVCVWLGTRCSPVAASAAGSVPQHMLPTACGTRGKCHPGLAAQPHVGVFCCCWIKVGDLVRGKLGGVCVRL